MFYVVECFCKHKSFGSEIGGDYFEVYPAYGVYITGFQVCESGNPYWSNTAAGFDLYYSDGSTQQVLGCESRIDPYPLVKLPAGDRITRADIWVGSSGQYTHDMVEGIRFHSLTGIWGPYGLATGILISEKGSALVGFHGRRGAALNRVGFIWESCYKI